MTPEQKAKIEENRRKALERLQQKGMVTKSNTARDDAVKQKIAANREAALAKLKAKQGNLRDASSNSNPSLEVKKMKPLDRIQRGIQRSDYIEYDFSTMKDSFGGFINEEKADEPAQTLEEWQEKNNVEVEARVPIDLENAPKCIECGTIDLNTKLKEVFHVNVCKSCERRLPEKYALLTKTECKEDYFLTDPELNDPELLAHMEKPNPHSGTYSRMQLYMRFQIEEYAFKKWGGEEGLDNEWKRREEGKIQRREKKYQMKMREMRKKTRAEEYTRKLQEQKFGKQHVHEFSQAIDGGKDEDGFQILRRRCIGCGIETEEIAM